MSRDKRQKFPQNLPACIEAFKGAVWDTLTEKEQKRTHFDPVCVFTAWL